MTIDELLKKLNGELDAELGEAKKKAPKHPGLKFISAKKDKAMSEARKSKKGGFKDFEAKMAMLKMKKLKGK
jgi:hypothetical protein